jgi:hypothetical protein
MKRHLLFIAALLLASGVCARADTLDDTLARSEAPAVAGAMSTPPVDTATTPATGLMKKIPAAPVPDAAASAPAPGAGPVVPQALQRRWDFPRCRFAELFFTVSRHFTMRGDRSSAFIERVLSAQDKSGRTEIKDNKKSYLLEPAPKGKDGGDAQLNLYYLAVETPETRAGFEKNPSAVPGTEMLTYSHCPDEKLPDWLPLSGSRLGILAMLDAAMDSCGSAAIMDNPTCQRNVFSQFDADGDGSLTYHELVNAYVRLAFIVAGASCNFQVAFDAAYVDRRAVLFASEAISFLDHDKSGGVDLEEARDLNAIPPQSFAFGFLQELKTLYTILPFLPESAQHYTCVSCGAPEDGTAAADGGGCAVCAAAEAQR